MECAKLTGLLRTGLELSIRVFAGAKERILIVCNLQSAKKEEEGFGESLVREVIRRCGLKMKMQICRCSDSRAASLLQDRDGISKSGELDCTTTALARQP